LWGAVDQSGEVLDVLVQRRRSKRAAKRFFRKLLKALRYSPRTVVTDKLRSYAAAKAEMMPAVAHHCGRRMNNRAENSRISQRGNVNDEWQRFKRMRRAQRFCSVFSAVCNEFRPGPHTLSASNYRALMGRRFAHWNDVVETNSFVTQAESLEGERHQPRLLAIAWQITRSPNNLTMP
jgi:putative transposase